MSHVADYGIILTLIVVSDLDVALGTFKLLPSALHITTEPRLSAYVCALGEYGAYMGIKQKKGCRVWYIYI